MGSRRRGNRAVDQAMDQAIAETRTIKPRWYIPLGTLLIDTATDRKKQSSSWANEDRFMHNWLL